MTWTYDEAQHAGAEHLDDAQVEAYDQKAQVPAADELEWLRALGLNTQHTLVDLGAGTGEVALAAAAVCRRVVAVDVSPTMVRLLKSKAQARGVTNMEVVQAGFLSYAHEGEGADFVYSRNALHHLPDFWKVQALERIAGLLKPGGVFVLRDLVYSFSPEDSAAALETWFGHADASTLGGYPRSELEAHVRDEHSTYAWLLEAILGRVGLRIEAAEYGAFGVFARYVCSRAR
jgi:SAM-dependent methyltransferase